VRIALCLMDARDRLRAALREHWRRVLIGAFVGWLYAVVGGAFALASLEFWGAISRSASDELGIVIVLAGTGLGALQSYRWKT
jgi:hypothetical protein